MSRDNKGADTTFLPCGPFGRRPLSVGNLHTARVEGLEAGIYYYNPPGNQIRPLFPGDKTNEISGSIIYPEITRGASMVIVITGLFERSVFKYGDRGYRFVLLEAGHVAQNLNLAVVAVGLGPANIG